MSNTNENESAQSASESKIVDVIASAVTEQPIDYSPNETTEDSLEAQAQVAFQEQLNNALKTGELQPYFLMSAVSDEAEEVDANEALEFSNVDLREVLDFRTKSAPPVPVKRTTKSNLSENPFGAYKATGKWVALSLRADNGLNLADWQTQAGNLHYSSSLKLHSVQVPWYMQWSSKPRHVKMIFQVGYDPYPDLNPDLKNASDRDVSKICRALVATHLSFVKVQRVQTQSVKPRVRHWGESWPKCIHRLATERFNRHAVASWLRSKIHKWEFRTSRKKSLAPQPSAYAWADPLED